MSSPTLPPDNPSHRDPDPAPEGAIFAKAITQIIYPSGHTITRTIYEYEPTPLTEIPPPPGQRTTMVYSYEADLEE